MRLRSLLLARNAVYYFLALVLSGLFALTIPLIIFPMKVGWPIVVAYLRSLLFLLKWICGLTFEVRGIEKLPPGPVLIASAHQTTWENLFFPLIFNNPAIMVKEELLGYLLVGAIARKNGHIPAHRSGDLEAIRQSFELARATAVNGRSILIFPTGTRTGTNKMPPLRRGVAALYHQLELPCVPVAHNSGLYWQNGSWLRRPGTIVVEILDPIPAGLDKKSFMQNLSDQLTATNHRLLSMADMPSSRSSPAVQAESLDTTAFTSRK